MHETIAAYMPHGMCLLWKPWLLGLHAGSDFLTFAAYFAIPAGIFLFLRQRPDLPLRPVAWLFIAFICLCGLTHLVAIFTLWNPVYEFFGALKLVTAIVSVLTAVMVFRLIPAAVAMPTQIDLQRLNDRLSDEVAAHRETLEELRTAKVALESQFARQRVELEQARAMLHVVSAATPTMIYAKDAAGLLTYANPALQNLLGKDEAELLGTDENAFLDDPAEARAIKENDRAIMESGQSTTVEETVTTENGKPRTYLSSKAPVLDENGAVQGLVGVSVDITDRKHNEQRLAVLLSELKHRGANQIAIISHIARRSLTPEKTMEEARDAFIDRLMAIARSLEMVSATTRDAMDLRELARERLESHGAVEVQGPSVRLTPKASQTMSLTIHELLTNAMKYGALSDQGGAVDVDWTVSDGELHFRWRERGGPPVTPPQRTGFGRNVIESLVRQDFDATVEISFETSGLQYAFTAPLSRLTGED